MENSAKPGGGSNEPVLFVNWHTFVQSMEKCNFDDTMMCDGVNGWEDACDRDYVGPLVSKYCYLVGVVLCGCNCKTKGYPSVYADISQFEGWIRNVTVSAPGIQFMSVTGVGSGLSYRLINTTSTSVGTTSILTTRLEQYTIIIFKRDPNTAKNQHNQKREIYVRMKLIILNTFIQRRTQPRRPHVQRFLRNQRKFVM